MNYGVQISVSHAGASVLIGTVIESLVPPHDENKSLNWQALEFAVQAGLNGALIAVAAPYLQEEDPTGGGIFFTSLWGSQPQWHKRIKNASHLAKVQIGRLTNSPLLKTV